MSIIKLYRKLAGLSPCHGSHYIYFDSRRKYCAAENCNIKYYTGF